MSDLTQQPSSCRQCLSLKVQLENICNSRAEPLNLMLAALLRGSKTFRLVRSELGFRINIRDFGEDIEHNTLLRSELADALDHVQKAASNFPQVSPSIPEKLLVGCRHIIWSVVSSMLSMPFKERALWFLTFVQSVLEHNMAGSREYHQLNYEALSHVLAEPKKNIGRFLRWHQYFLYINYSKRLRHLNYSEDKKLNTNSFVWAERDAYKSMSGHSNESRVLVTIHMGDFFGAFKCIASEMEAPRPVISLRRDGDYASIKRISSRHADKHNVFEPGRDNLLKIISSLRRGGYTLAVLFDLGSEFGETTEVKFFGYPARFVRGPAEMAIVGRARIYPFVSFSQQGQDTIDMGESFFPRVSAGESLQDAITRVTQKLVGMAEMWIKKNPAQWKYLDSLPSYLVNENQASLQSQGKYA